jgi:hypothetical protein
VRTARPTFSNFNNGTLPNKLLLSVIPNDLNFKINLLLFSPLTRFPAAYNNISLSPSSSLGESFVVFGASKSSNDVDLTSNAFGSRYQSLLSTEVSGGGLQFDAASRSVASVRDINKDRFNDLVIGDPNNGKVYVLFGTVNGYSNMNSGFTMTSQSGMDYFGWSVSSAGDFNHDGYDDILISAMLTGLCYVIYGKDTGYMNLQVPSSTTSPPMSSRNGLLITPATRTMNTGFTVSSAGDFNGDGIDDIAISAKQSSNVNIVYMIYGSRSSNLPGNGIMNLDQLTTSQGFIISSPPLSFVGISLANLGDVNGDRFADIAIGSLPYHGGFKTQVSYVIYGNENYSSLNLQSLTPEQGFTINGGGIMVFGPGDIDGDGINDILISNYLGWQGKFGSLLITAPKARMTRHPTQFPTSSPSIQKSFPSSNPSSQPTLGFVFPSSSPSQAVPSPRNKNDNSTSRPTIKSSSASPSFKPTKSSSAPTTSKPSRTSAPSVGPTIERTSIPTVSPSLSPTTRAPTFKITRLPTVRPTINLNPTSVPSQAPTIDLKTIFEVKTISQGGRYNATSPAQQFIIDSPEDTSFLGSTGRNRFTIKPNHPHVNITILSFNLVEDVIDFSQYPGITDLSLVSYKTDPLRLILPRGEQIIFPFMISFEFSESNFIFSDISDSSSSSDSKKAGIIDLSVFSSGVTSTVTILGGLLFVSFLFSRFIAADSQKKGKEKKTTSKKHSQRTNKIQPLESRNKSNKNDSRQLLIPVHKSHSLEKVEEKDEREDSDELESLFSHDSRRSLSTVDDNDLDSSDSSSLLDDYSEDEEEIDSDELLSSLEDYDDEQEHSEDHNDELQDRNNCSRRNPIDPTSFSSYQQSFAQSALNNSSNLLQAHRQAPLPQGYREAFEDDQSPEQGYYPEYDKNNNHRRIPIDPASFSSYQQAFVQSTLNGSSNLLQAHRQAPQPEGYREAFELSSNEEDDEDDDQELSDLESDEYNENKGGHITGLLSSAAFPPQVSYGSYQQPFQFPPTSNLLQVRRQAPMPQAYREAFEHDPNPGQGNYKNNKSDKNIYKGLQNDTNTNTTATELFPTSSSPPLPVSSHNYYQQPFFHSTPNISSNLLQRHRQAPLPQAYREAFVPTTDSSPPFSQSIDNSNRNQNHNYYSRNDSSEQKQDLEEDDDDSLSDSQESLQEGNHEFYFSRG